MRLPLPCLVAFATSVSAIGNALVLNNSTSTIYAWSVGSAVGERQAIVSGGLYMEPLHRDAKTGGIAIKMTKGPDGLYNGEPQQVFSYNLDGEQVWYDLSSVFGAPFAGQRVEVTSNTGGPIVWPAGVHPGGSQVKVARSDENVWFTVYGSK
ncbi:hypothetical protein BKA63DRAFT_136149 [Paraphoma chrysanthemicola]|nr:hypothetical protein BKA63DRAFT_136149 [Paraphoma chrysanthemicola]